MDAIDEVLTRGVDTIYPTREALEKVLRSGKKIKLYEGFDPTGIQLHIGHLTGLQKLAQFQKLGHEVIFLIGDGTGQAGDPSGKKRNRDKYLSNKELRKNSKDYVLQASKIVKFEGENAAKIVYNGDWLNKLTLSELLDIAGHFTLAQLEERDMYEERRKEGIDINFREFMYPLLQGYDSVAIAVDLEIGGSDQMFNMLAGRKLVRDMLGKEKFVLTTPLLTDKSGRKIGKSEGNVIALTSSPHELYGMIMSLPDDVIGKSFEMITDLPMDEVNKIQEKLTSGDNPMLYKKKLAFELVRMLNDKDSAKKAQENFENTFQKKGESSDLKILEIPSQFTSLATIVRSGYVKTNSDGRRLLSQGAFELNGQKITDPNLIMSEGKIKIGKHGFYNVKINKDLK